jgi:ribonuclease HI
MTENLSCVIIYTDGGCRPNPGPGGWGAVLLHSGRDPVELSGGKREATNNRMEMVAAIEALGALDGSHRVELYTDSTYLKKGITEWLSKWRAKGWKTAAKKDVKNRDLWEELDKALQIHEVSWHWTKGHAGDRWNEVADELASAAIPRAPLPINDTKAVHLFTAVAYSGKKKAGSWGVVLRFADEEKGLSDRVAGASANRMHLLSAISGLEELKRRVRVHLYTVSDYLKDGATSWVPGWRQRGWKTREGKPVSHRDLWQKVDDLAGRHDVTWHVVDGKALPTQMEYAKQLAKDALKLDV